ncbi:cytochrome P450 4V2-like [Amphiura filiformis]|uniref:cytochrome P450 4V2-like n=1 Tax=Amphiura filiformis TaxID=82378 RepID=UPI003B2157B0
MSLVITASVILAFLAVYLAYNFVFKPYKLWVHFNKMPGVPAVPLLGNAHQFEREPVAFFKQIQSWCNDYPGRFFRMWLGPVPAVIMYNAKDAEIIFNSNKHITKGFVYKFLMKWLGTGLLTSTGEKWFHRRKMLTPTFHFRILNDFLEVFNEQADILVEKLDEHADGKVLNIFPEITLCVLDIICETAMGKKINAQGDGNSEYVKAVIRMSDLVQERQKTPWFWPESVYHRLGIGKEYEHCLHILHGLTKSVIRERYEERQMSRNPTESSSGDRKSKRLAFLDLLLTMQDEDSSFTFSDIQEEVDTFMFEGHDTTAAASSWALYLLGLHPEIQQRVLEELDQVFEYRNEPCSMEKLNQLTYLGCVLKEALRIYPSVPFIARKLEEDCKIHGYDVPKGTEAVLLIYMLHRDPEYFPDPEKFDPDRFLASNTTKRHPYSYVPFSAGARNCIGQKFALLEEKVVVATILRRFQVESVDSRDQVNVLAELILRPEKGIHVKLTRRH